MLKSFFIHLKHNTLLKEKYTMTKAIIDYEQLKIKSYTYWDIYLHENQCYLGRVFVQLKDNTDIEDFLSISGEVRNEFFNVGENIKGSLRTLFKPDKMNYAALSNVSPVIHMHIVPRYKDPRTFEGIQFVDSRWGKNYAPYDQTFILELPALLKIKEAIRKELK